MTEKQKKLEDQESVPVRELKGLPEKQLAQDALQAAGIPFWIREHGIEVAWEDSAAKEPFAIVYVTEMDREHAKVVLDEALAETPLSDDELLAEEEAADVELSDDDLDDFAEVENAEDAEDEDEDDDELA